MGPKNMQINYVTKPMITVPKDAIVRVTQCSICGSDLHMCEFLQLSRNALNHEVASVF
jgi:threonine dehydrogenase-like Zn-dependent dehydrogenase